MIVHLRQEHIPDIALAHISAWRVAFKGIMSDDFLSSLETSEFEKVWAKIIMDPSRTNAVWLNSEFRAIGFVSYGMPKDRAETAEFEIYGIYVDPQFWSLGIGQKLMHYAVTSIRSLKPDCKVILWTMDKNLRSRSFYERFGFRITGHNRISHRDTAFFNEIKYKLSQSIPNP